MDPNATARGNDDPKATPFRKPPTGVVPLRNGSSVSDYCTSEHGYIQQNEALRVQRPSPVRQAASQWLYTAFGVKWIAGVHNPAVVG